MLHFYGSHGFNILGFWFCVLIFTFFVVNHCPTGTQAWSPHTCCLLRSTPEIHLPTVEVRVPVAG